MISFTSLATSAILWTATPSPEPTLYPAYEGDPNLVTPGVLGFIGILFVAVATLVIVMDMNRRVRRVRYRALAQETIRAEQAAAAGETDGLTEGAADDSAESGDADAGDADDAAPTQRAD
ncbi:hypothetical protein [Salinibacterium sp. SWN248]|uniref:hypothetical protein n=1 Tax=Salinibacterium sp. SWN248 TaxID=2792056 RepID=UPI0018CCDAEB|nr:hypothetical protein [Salinibacterium sp. SWN248]MBH0024662.1 hypothetical protein [Salinibacterium sp. SWN248]